MRRRWKRRLNAWLWPITNTTRAVTLDGEPYKGRVSITMRINAPTTMEPQLKGVLKIETIAERRLFGRWVPTHVGRLDVMMIDGQDPMQVLLTTVA